jgi:hypothetical protein
MTEQFPVLRRVFGQHHARQLTIAPCTRSLTNGLEIDRSAMDSTVTLPYHNGHTEGVNTHTKRIMRQMHGRAGFTLLRHRIPGCRGDQSFSRCDRSLLVPGRQSDHERVALSIRAHIPRAHAEQRSPALRPPARPASRVR